VQERMNQNCAVKVESELCSEDDRTEQERWSWTCRGNDEPQITDWVWRDKDRSWAGRMNRNWAGKDWSDQCRKGTGRAIKKQVSHNFGGDESDLA
jgi:hypothetical protein